ncbi:MAG: phosphatidate cytidylyltransferase [Alphaproteobacteria bacterium]
MVRPQAEAPGRDFARRVLSALVVAPPAILAVVAGGTYFDALVLTAVVVLAWEWDRMCDGRFGLAGLVLVASVAAVVFAGSAHAWRWGLGIAALGAIAVFLAERRRNRDAGAWTAFGAIYIGIPALAALWLRADPEAGRAIMLWLIAVTAATDIGAYAVGRMIGGAKLAPHISPGKTWSGLAGGIGTAAAAGYAFSVITDANGALFALASALLACIGQGGDLFESFAKRRFGRKDMSGLMPGHGGLFDRVDGLVAVIMAAALATLLSGEMITQW